MAATITEISIRGYKSIARLDRLPLRPLNVLVGANGAGRSNLCRFLTFVSDIGARRLGSVVRQAGGADALLHLGGEASREIGAEL